MTKDVLPQHVRTYETPNGQLRRARRGALLTIAALLLLPLLGQGVASAEMTPSKSQDAVTLVKGHDRISWKAPRGAGRKVQISNKSSDSEGSTILTLKDRLAPTSYDFKIDLAVGLELVATDDGGFDVVRQNPVGSVQVGHIDAPWAIDSTGRALVTTFTYSNSILTQQIDTRDATFPVTADPKFTWGITSGTIYFNKSETSKAGSSWGYVATAAVLAPPPWDVVIALDAGYISFIAGWAASNNHCLKIKLYPSPYPYVVPLEYSGGYCR